MKKLKQIFAAFMLCMLATVSYTQAVQSIEANSTNYGVSEVNFNSGGMLNACSSLYCSRQAAGETAVGNTTDNIQNYNSTPSADSYVNSGAPTVNYGASTVLRTSSSTNRTYLKFDTSSIPANAVVTSVALELYSTNSGGGSYQIYSQSDGWTEAGLTWNNQPAWSGNLIATSAEATTNAMVSIPLPMSAINKGSNTNLAVMYSTTSFISTMNSREVGSNMPRLLITYGSGGYTAAAGANTNRDPVLEMSVTGTPIDLGVLASAATKSGSTTFSVRTFPAYGYNVIVDGTSPKNKTGGYALSTMSTMGASQPGVEQFGINLRQNTTPAIGANAVHVPDDTFAFGAAAPGYGTQNNYKYTAGDVIAQSAKGTGLTNYTMSVIANISTTTPGGSYGGRLVLIAVPTF